MNNLPTRVRDCGVSFFNGHFVQQFCMFVESNRVIDNYYHYYPLRINSLDCETPLSVYYGCIIIRLVRVAVCSLEECIIVRELSHESVDRVVL